jgi:hypothetical protein
MLFPLARERRARDNERTGAVEMERDNFGILMMGLRNKSDRVEGGAVSNIEV